ncbi:LolA family protein [Aquimarina muelleri]|uniref:Cell envelope biogenesis protein LolA n=1 Tax=Aquimarina muelleri TaxID=279356 RepID=A0A918JWF7_9FLAO|nr:outer membrane lipoprotein carrier protein LolA [Aquimarina muelleri]MCX2762008.1 outer membrane lipoprotein carrier protein LolA [Aquimarina muelleri]GGX25046.1 cell envelope biogenesis protein LolA [Aquimarina muelleri]
MHKIICLILFITTTLHAQTKMSIAEINALKEKVKTHAIETKTISSDFTQYKHLDFLSNDIITTGKLAFKTPNMVKWEYIKPFKYSVIFKNETLYINDEGNKNKIDIGASEQFKKLNHLIVSSLKGDMFDDNEFVINYYKKQGNSEVHFGSKDKKFKKYIKVFYITFDSDGDVIEIKIIEPSNDYTRIVFSNRILNSSLPDEVFTH